MVINSRHQDQLTQLVVDAFRERQQIERENYFYVKSANVSIEERIKYFLLSRTISRTSSQVKRVTTKGLSSKSPLLKTVFIKGICREK